MNTYVILDNSNMYTNFSHFFNSYYALIEHVCISLWPAPKYHSYEW